MTVPFRAWLVTVGVAAIAFPLTFAVWPPTVPVTAPGAAQALGYGLLAAECLAMGGGFAFLLFGYPAIKRLPVRPQLAVAAYGSIAFHLLNWWAHDHLHAVADRLDFNGFIWMNVVLEYCFHAGMIVLGGVLALFFAQALTGAAPADASARGRGLRWRVALVTVTIAVISIPASLVIFPPPQLPLGQRLPDAVLPFLLGMKLFEGLGLGTGIAFLVFGRGLLRGAKRSVWALPAFLAVAWCLVNWWPHDNLHLINGNNIWGLLGIEYGFHLTLMAAAGVLALFFIRNPVSAEQSQPNSRTVPPASAPVVPGIEAVYELTTERRS